MKPPARLRAAPLRFHLSHHQPRVSWTAQEKRRLIRALKAQSPAQGSLQPEVLREHIPSKSEAEILAFVHQLKSRVTREAVQTHYRRYQNERRRKETQVLAPIEVWAEMAEKLTDPLEDAITTAFSQVLTIAAVEPCSLLHSVPPKPSRAAERTAPQNPACPEQGGASSGNASPRSPAAAATPGTDPAPALQADRLHVDFERIYKYLSALSRGAKPLQLSPAESAVLLELLLSLPEELRHLNYEGLRSHLNRCYRELSTQSLGRQHRVQSGEQDSGKSPAVNSATSSEPQQGQPGSFLTEPQKGPCNGSWEDSGPHEPSSLPSQDHAPGAAPPPNAHMGDVPPEDHAPGAAAPPKAHMGDVPPEDHAPGAAPPPNAHMGDVPPEDHAPGAAPPPNAHMGDVPPEDHAPGAAPPPKAHIGDVPPQDRAPGATPPHKAHIGDVPPEDHAPGAAPPPKAPNPDWKAVGVCPLNSFLIPLHLLAQRGGSLS
uniref:snRNA-activating protein complex subunit 2 n=1 Tax=Sphenodon punctatus TaxID=8508 RepID=A0A8D0HHD3_SPHPU